MNELSKSPDKNTFQLKSYIERVESDPTDQEAQSMIDLLNSIRSQADTRKEDPNWKENNLEYDLCSTDWILEKARTCDNYAQNIYAALCNVDWQKLDVLPILKEETWGCSWRYAGGIVADMRQEGDYIDWYCSGIRSIGDNGYVSEGIVTEEIQQDLEKIGWIPIYPDDDDMI